MAIQGCVSAHHALRRVRRTRNPFHPSNRSYGDPMKLPLMSAAFLAMALSAAPALAAPPAAAPTPAPSAPAAAPADATPAPDAGTMAPKKTTKHHSSHKKSKKAAGPTPGRTSLPGEGRFGQKTPPRRDRRLSGASFFPRYGRGGNHAKTPRPRSGRGRGLPRSGGRVRALGPGATRIQMRPGMTRHVTRHVVHTPPRCYLIHMARSLSIPDLPSRAAPRASDARPLLRLLRLIGP
jgi:hypothetical protein